MEQFNLEEYLKNPSRKVITKDGRNARILCTDRDHPVYTVVALIKNDKYYNESEDVMCYSSNGEHFAKFDTDPAMPTKEDLFFAPSKKSWWVFLYKTADGELCTSIPYESKKAADEGIKLANARGMQIVVKAIQEITWEE